MSRARLLLVDDDDDEVDSSEDVCEPFHGDVCELVEVAIPDFDDLDLMEMGEAVLTVYMTPDGELHQHPYKRGVKFYADAGITLQVGDSIRVTDRGLEG